MTNTIFINSANHFEFIKIFHACRYIERAVKPVLIPPYIDS